MGYKYTTMDLLSKNTKSITKQKTSYKSQHYKSGRQATNPVAPQHCAFTILYLLTIQDVTARLTIINQFRDKNEKKYIVICRYGVVFLTFKKTLTLSMRLHSF